jgi:hypothetical protein
MKSLSHLWLVENLRFNQSLLQKKTTNVSYRSRERERSKRSTKYDFFYYIAKELSRKSQDEFVTELDIWLRARTEVDIWLRVRTEADIWLRVRTEMDIWLRVRTEVDIWLRVRAELDIWLLIRAEVDIWLRIRAELDIWLRARTEVDIWLRIRTEVGKRITYPSRSGAVLVYKHTTVGKRIT